MVARSLRAETHIRKPFFAKRGMPNSGLAFPAKVCQHQSIPAQVCSEGPRMNAHEKVYQRLVNRGFCHLSTDEMDQYVHKARWRMGLAAVFAAAAVLAYVLSIRPF
jgi:hypothetical protein